MYDKNGKTDNIIFILFNKKKFVHWTSVANVLRFVFIFNWSGFIDYSRHCNKEQSFLPSIICEIIATMIIKCFWIKNKKNTKIICTVLDCFNIFLLKKKNEKIT